MNLFLIQKKNRQNSIFLKIFKIYMAFKILIQLTKNFLMRKKSQKKKKIYK